MKTKNLDIILTLLILSALSMGTAVAIESAEPQSSAAIPSAPAGPQTATVEKDEISVWSKYMKLGKDQKLKGHFQDAEDSFTKALELSGSFKILDPNRVVTLNALAGIYRSLQKYSQAESLYRQALPIAEINNGPASPMVGTLSDNLGLALDALHHNKEGELLHKKAIEIFENNLPDSNPELAVALSSLSQDYIYEKRYADAETVLKRAIAIEEKLNSSTDRSNLPTSLDNLASVYYKTGQLEKSEKFAKRALELFEKSYGPNHPETATCLQNLAVTYIAEHKPQQAVPLLARALSIYKQTLGIDHPITQDLQKQLDQEQAVVPSVK